MKKLVVLLSVLWWITLPASAQPIDSSRIFVEADEEIAQFPGGEAACFKFLSEHIVYPVQCQKEGIQGRVIVTFIVGEDGSISEIKTMRSPDPALTKEAERVVALMPKWKPARQGAKTVRSRFTIPIMFRLPEDSVASKRDTLNVMAATENVADDRVYEVVETAASFPGGTDECMKWLNSHVRYPRECLEEGIQGRVIVSFVVGKDGSIENVKEMRSPHPALTKEMIRLVSSMPKWKPAMQDGKPVRSRFSLPMMFRLR